MFLANIELANPVMLTVKNSFIAYQNTVIDGQVITKILRYPSSGAPYAQMRSLIRLNFSDIPPADIGRYREAYRLATLDYVQLLLSGLGLTLQYDADHGVVDAAFVTVAPGSSLGMDVTPGSTISSVTGLMDGPYLYAFTMSFVTGDFNYSNDSNGN
jgi:hypothetical protein